MEKAGRAPVWQHPTGQGGLIAQREAPPGLANDVVGTRHPGFEIAVFNRLAGRRRLRRRWKGSQHQAAERELPPVRPVRNVNYQPAANNSFSRSVALRTDMPIAFASELAESSGHTASTSIACSAVSYVAGGAASQGAEQPRIDGGIVLSPYCK